ncbi:YxiJ family protein [Brevibacillus borstelensis]|uniref:YxiJ family protein n=1 Tax=Brevibacillus borstelensis TaxID=45462 RepID=UPI0030D3180E
MKSEEMLEKISRLYNFQLVNPFPYEDTNRIKIDFESEFELLEEENLNADFNDYCTLIVGTTSYILKGNVANIPKKQIEFLNEDFFQRFPQYSFIKAKLENYPDFQNEYIIHEELRKIIFDYLQSN